MLENAWVTTFVVSDLLRENHQGVVEGEWVGEESDPD